MNLSNLNYLIYSSHKTSTQSLLSIFKNNNLNSLHCHSINNFNDYYNTKKSFQELKKDFLYNLEKYKIDNNKKLNIISVVRNPIKRFPSSFFQFNHDREIRLYGENINSTTIMRNNINDLLDMYKTQIINNVFPTKLESIDEMTKIFEINIIDKLGVCINNDYYLFEHELFNLYVLDFEKVINSDNLSYLNKCLDLKMTTKSCDNLSSNKIYYDKYCEFKKHVSDMDDIIKLQINPFYFNAFIKEKS